MATTFPSAYTYPGPFTYPDNTAESALREIELDGSIEPDYLQGWVEADVANLNAVRTIYVTGGYGDYLWLDALTTPAVDMSSDTIVFGYTPNLDGDVSSTVPPTAWLTTTSPDEVQFPDVGQVRFGSFLGTGGHTIAPGDYFGWLDVTDDPTIQPIFCGRFTII